MSPVTGTLSTGEPLDFQETGASGTVTAWDAGTQVAKFTIETTIQPSLGETVLRDPTFSGTFLSVSVDPQFIANVTVADIFLPLHESPVPSFEVATIPTRSHLQLSTNFVGTSSDKANFLVSNSFTPNFGFAYAESGDQEPAEIGKRGILRVDEFIQTATGTGVTSINTLFGVVTLSGFDGLTVTELGKNISLTSFHPEFVSASGVLAAIVESHTLPLPFPGSGSDGTGDGSEAVDFLFDYPGIVNQANVKTTTGSLNYSVTIGGVMIGGLDNQVANTSGAIHTATSANSFSEAEELLVLISGATNVERFRFTLKTTRT